MKQFNHTGLLLQDILWASLCANGATQCDLDKQN